MAFVKKDWQNRIVPFPYRRRLTIQSVNIQDPETGLQVGDQIVCTIVRDEYDEEPDWSGTSYQQGDAFSATNMNGLEQRIYDAVDATGVDSKMDKVNPEGSGTLSINRLSSSQVGNNSVAVGSDTTASGASSVAEGDSTVASGDQAHAEGDSTVAGGENSHAEGSHTIASSDNQHVFGTYNVEDNSDTYIEIVGNGTANNARSNARTLDPSGNEVIAGDLTFNGNTSLTTALSNKADASSVPTDTSDLNNDSGFIDNTVNDLVNYYLKTETYTQAEVNTLINAITTIQISVVASLPVSDISQNTIYLVPSSDPGQDNYYDEYINLDGTSAGWELIGTTAVSGSTVSWNQISTSGTKIAEVTINGTTTDVYAPNSGGGGATTLGGLDDVTITSATDGQAILYDSANSIWKNSNLPTSSSTLDGLTDVTISSPTDGQALIYDSNSGEWVNGSGGGGSSTLSGLTDVTISSATDGQVLTYDSSSSKWVNAAVPSGATALSSLTDVTITSATNGQVLMYDSANSKWVNGNGGGGASYTDVTGTLTAGSTSLTLSDAAITTSSTLDFYTDTYGVNPTAVSVSTGSVTLTFASQGSNLGVKVRVW